MRRLFIASIALAFIAMFAVVTGNKASAQATCTYYTVKVGLLPATCLPITITTSWANPPLHNAQITTTGTTIVPSPGATGFVAPLRAVFIDGIQVFPNPTPTHPVIQLPCGICVQVAVEKEVPTGCLLITITPHPGPC